MKTAIILSSLLFIASLSSADPFHTEKKIIKLSENWNTEMMMLSEYGGLKDFCTSFEQRKSIFALLDEIHQYHDELEEEFKTTTYNHSKRTIKRILKHIDKLDSKYHPEQFTEFFKSQCSLQSKIEKNADHYSAGFGPHSYGGKVYVQEVEMYRYLNRLSRRIERIKKHVERFYVRRQVWEH